MQKYSFEIYPKPDPTFKSKVSLDYLGLIKSNIYQRFFPRSKKVSLYSWLIFGFVGIIMGVIAFFIDVLVE